MHRTAATLLALVLALSFSAGCGGDDDGDAPAAGSGGGGAGAGSGGAGGSSGGASGSSGSSGNAGSSASTGAALYGSFVVSWVPADVETMSDARTSIIGKLYDGPTPNPDVWKVESEMNGCKLSVPEQVLCQPPCGSSGTCVATNMCAQYPKPMTAGTVTLTGIGASPIAMDPVANNYQPKASAGVPYPPCVEGDEVSLAAGSGSDAIAIKAKCIAPLTFDGEYTLQKGQPLQLKWGAPGKADVAKIGVKLDISHHGGSTGKIECSVDDTGSLTIAAAQVDRLVELGAAGFPTVTLTRQVVAAGSGSSKDVTLTLAAAIERPVVIPGLVSCSEDTDCPSGQTCQSNRACK